MINGLGATTLQDGRAAALEVLEITAVPHWQLLGADVKTAAETVDSLFALLTNDIHRRDASGNLSAELLFVAAPAQNQTYRAQTRMFLVLRGIGLAGQEILDQVRDIARNVEFALNERGYVASRMTSDDQLQELGETLAKIDGRKVSAIGRQERVVSTQSGVSLYYNDVVYPSLAEKASLITNAMSGCPDSAISLQLIPTAYTDVERVGIEQRRTYVDAMRAQVMMTPGAVVPSVLSDAAISYVDFIDTAKDNIYYFNFLVFAGASDVGTLAGKVIDVIQEDGQIGSHAMTMVDVSDGGFSLSEYFAVSPWVNCDKLVHESREAGYWQAQGAPVELIRMKYLAPSRVVRAIFKLPFDDDATIGIASKRSRATREKLHEVVLSKSSFRVGTIIGTPGEQDDLAQAGVPLNDFARHALVVGASGYGKTNFALGMLLRFWREFKIPFLAIEPTKTEYRSLLDAIPDLNVFTPGRNEVSPFIINPFIPPPNVTIESYVPSLMTAFGAAFEMPDPLPGIFRAAVNDCYNHYGWKSTSTLDDPNAQRFGFYEFIRIFKERVARLDYQGETKANIESAGVVRLTSLIEQNPNIYDTINTIPFEALLAKPTVIELNAIGDKEQKSLLMALLLVSMVAYTKNNVSLDGKLKNVFLIDEAHVLLGGNSGQDPGAKSSTVEALEDMIAEIRAYGTGIVIADQSPSNVGRNIIANTDVKVLFRLVERQNREMVGAATNMAPAEETLLARLGTGECLLHYGRLDFPLHVKVDDVQKIAPMAQSISNDRVHREVAFWDSRPLLLRPYRECPLSRSCSEGCDFSTRVDADFLAAQIVSYFQDYVTSADKLSEFLLFRAADSVGKAVRRSPGMVSSQRLSDCTTIKTVRKILLAKSFKIDDKVLARLFRDERTMPRFANG